MASRKSSLAGETYHFTINHMPTGKESQGLVRTYFPCFTLIKNTFTEDSVWKLSGQ